jgi:hypothetical protein
VTAAPFDLTGQPTFTLAVAEWYGASVVETGKVRVAPFGPPPRAWPHSTRLTGGPHLGAHRIDQRVPLRKERVRAEANNEDDHVSMAAVVRTHVDLILDRIGA